MLAATTMWSSILAVTIGGAAGCLARYGLGAALNALFAPIPPGTLAANLIGAYLVGLAIAFFGLHAELSPQWRLLVVTGFLGGLTTFSSFSGEVVLLLQQGRLAMACAAIGLHLGGSLLLSFAGMATVAAVSSRGL